MLFLTVLFGIVMVILAFALMKDRGLHTEYARRDQAARPVEDAKQTGTEGRAFQLH